MLPKNKTAENLISRTFAAFETKLPLGGKKSTCVKKLRVAFDQKEGRAKSRYASQDEINAPFKYY